MRNSNSPEAKNRKRKVALSNLEKKLSNGGHDDQNGQFVPLSDSGKKRIEAEVAVLKGRITG